MPQININEIDESLYTRVNSNNNLLKVFVPGIATFGPVYDGTEYSLQSFTNKQDFQKVFGYNLPEQNPIKNDYSKLYAEQLLDNGAEVSFVRLNEGITATFDIGINNSETQAPGVPVEDTIDNRLIIDAVKNGKEGIIEGNQYKFCTQITGISAKYSGSFGNRLMIGIQPVNSVNRAFTYQYANITVYKADTLEVTTKVGNVYTTKPVIKSLTKLESHIVSTNPYDTTYFEDVVFDFITINATDTARSEFTVIWSTLNGNYPTTDTILSGFPTIETRYQDKTSGKYVYNEAALLGNSTSTNDYNKYTLLTDSNAPSNWGTANTFYKLEGNLYVLVNFTGTGTEQDPFVPAYEANKYYTAEQKTKTSKGGTVGWDFQFSTGLQSVLATGFRGMTLGDGKYTYANVNRYNFECYAPVKTGIPNNTNPTYYAGGIVAGIYGNLVACFTSFTDPYIYEFDFITSGGLLDNTFTLDWNTGTSTDPANMLLPTATPDECSTAFATLASVEVFAKVTDSNGDLETNVGGISKLIPPLELKPTHLAMYQLVTERQDCIALIDPCLNWDPTKLTNYVRQINTTFATMHSPYCYINSPVAYELILMPPSYIFLMTELNTLITSGTEVQKWFPPAGVNRATARMVVKPYYEIGSVLLNEWQNDNLSRVNPIMKLKQYGYVIYGNYTCRVADDVNSFSALDSLNVRITANCVKQQIFNTCMTLTFEPNNSSLWMKFYDAMDKYLLFMKRNDGVYDYRIQMDESTVTTDDINQLRCPGKVWINPTRTAEFFDIDFTITEAGVTFTNAVGEGE